MRSVKVLKLFIVVALATTFHPVNAHEDYKHVLEADQQRLILIAYAHSPWLARDGIRVSVHEGKVSLNGKVGHPVASDLAGQIALGVKGISKVDNRIVVDSDYRSPLRSVLKHDGAIPANEDSVAQQRPLDIAPVTMATAETKTGWSVPDTWITAKVKSTLIYSGNVDSSDIAVNTNSGIVTLNGSVSGGAEHALVIERAKNIHGVRGVDASDFVNRSARRNSVAQVSY